MDDLTEGHGYSLNECKQSAQTAVQQYNHLVEAWGTHQTTGKWPDKFSENFFTEDPHFEAPLQSGNY